MIESTKFGFSLRGSLASTASILLEESGCEAVREYLNRLMAEKDVELVRYFENKMLVIGKRSELGQFPPDW